MNLSLHVLLLERAIGLYLLIASIIMLCRGSYYRELLMNIKPGSGAALVLASIGLMLGIMLVLVHNIWMWNFELLITIIAWGVLVKSVLWLAFPDCVVNCIKKMYSCCWMYYLMGLLMGLIGLMMIMHGCYMTQLVYV
jgi:hypothetical protein